MKKITGYIDTFIFYNENSGYGVFYLEDGTKAVGTIPHLNSGQHIELIGDWNSNLKFGKQFSFESFNILYPETSGEIIKFLSSGIIKGLGKKTAEIIVKKFGEETFKILDDEINRLYEIKGLGKNKIAINQKSWEKQKSFKDILIYLQSFGISTALAMKIFKIYGNQTKTVVKKNPYQLTYDVIGIGFKLADRIAQGEGFDFNHPYRIKAGILYVLNEAANAGHVYLPVIKLIGHCEVLLNYEMSKSDISLLELANEGMIKIVNERVYLSYLLYAENEIEKRIRMLASLHKNNNPNKLK